MTVRRVLMVSTYPPRRCGVATYARQAVAALRSAGDVVEVLSPPDGAGTYRAPLRGFLNPLRILWHGCRYDEVVVQYSHPDFYYGERPAKWFNWLTTASLLLTFLGLRRRLTVVVHEPPHFPNALHRRTLARLAWRLVPRVRFHTARERDAVEQLFGFHFRDGQAQLVDHKSHFRPFITMSQEEARRRLGVAPAATMFLCIGFLQSSKGFDRAVRVFAQSSLPGAHLYVVGSVRRPDDREAHAHRDELAALAQHVPNVDVLERYLSDEEFDTWLLASDYVVLPYRTGSSSSVLARAALLGRPAIVADVGGLCEQRQPSDLVFRSDDELAEIIRTLATAARLLPHSPSDRPTSSQY